MPTISNRLAVLLGLAALVGLLGICSVSAATASSLATISISSAPIIQPGLSGQAVGDILITEGAAGAITTNGINRNITLTCWEGYQFSNIPTVLVTEGNLSIKDVWIGTTNNIGDTIFIQVNSTSSIASKITVSNIKLDVASYVGTGPARIAVGGGALRIDVSRFPTVSGFGPAVVAQVTNADTTGATGTFVFTVGFTSYKVNGIEKTTEVPPYIKNDRTYLPVSYVAGCLGIASSNVIWDATNQTVTLVKGDKVVQLKIGSNSMSVNGASITTEVAPEICNSRTFLPIAPIAQVFGASVKWDSVAQTITVK